MEFKSTPSCRRKPLKCTMRLLSMLLVILVCPHSQAAQCPTWLDRYESFHAKTRGHPSAKYLVHEVMGLAGGLGDRLRGMLFAVRAASSLNRVVLFKWNHPYPLESFFQPASSIDWTFIGIEYVPGPVLRFIDAHHNDLKTGALMNVTAKFITLQTNMGMGGACFQCPVLQSDFSHDAVCLWQRLLRPIDALERRADALLLQMYGQRSPQYVGVHLRFGGLIGEGDQERGKSPLLNFIDAVSCARRLAHSASVTQATPILVITDNHHLRTFLQAGSIPSIVTTSAMPVHLDRASGRSLEQHQSTILDLVLLSRSKCLVLMRSGFGQHAWLYGGGTDCVAEIPGCKRDLMTR